MISIIFLILGLATTLLFPPYFIYPLGFIIFPAICFLIKEKQNKISYKKLFFYIKLYSIAFFGSFLFWIQNPFFVYDQTSNLFFISAILIILLSIIFSSIFLIIIFFNKFISIALIIPIIFTIFETIIALILYGFPWISFSLISSNINIFNISIQNFGTIVNSYLVIQIFCLPYFLIEYPKSIRNISISSTIIIMPLFVILIFNQNKEVKITKKIIDLELFQLNKPINTNEKNTESQPDSILSLIRESSADLILFAENNYPYIVNNDDLNDIQNILKDNQSVIIGATRFLDNKFYNSLFFIKNHKIQYYDKKILVPFGEFLPLRKYLNILDKISGPNDFTIGNKERILNVNEDLSFIPVICYEIIFYWKLINEKNHNSDFIINITNDVWFGKLLGPYQHFYLSKLRAAEFNKPIIRVSNNGISAIIDKNGYVVKKTKLNVKSNIKTKITISNSNNHYFSHKIINYYFLLILISLLIINLKIINGNK